MRPPMLCGGVSVASGSPLIASDIVRSGFSEAGSRGAAVAGEPSAIASASVAHASSVRILIEP